MDEEFDDATMDACLVAAGQRAEHYEIAAYGTLVAWATALDLTEVAGVLEDTLNEEKAADEALTALAEGGLNDAAIAGEDGDDDEDRHADRDVRTAAAPAPAVGRRQQSASTTPAPRATAGSTPTVKASRR
jgi:hypothetical protein